MPPFLLSSLGTQSLSSSRSSTADSSRRFRPSAGQGSGRPADPLPHPSLPRPQRASTRPKPPPPPASAGARISPLPGAPPRPEVATALAGRPCSGRAGSRPSTATAAAAVATAKAPASARPRPRPRVAATRPPARAPCLSPSQPPCRAPVGGEGRITTFSKAWRWGFCTISDDCYLVRNNLSRRRKGSWVKSKGRRGSLGPGLPPLCESGKYGVRVGWAPEPFLMGRSSDSWLPQLHRGRGYGRGACAGIPPIRLKSRIISTGKERDRGLLDPSLVGFLSPRSISNWLRLCGGGVYGGLCPFHV